MTTQERAVLLIPVSGNWNDPKKWDEDEDGRPLPGTFRFSTAKERAARDAFAAGMFAQLTEVAPDPDGAQALSAVAWLMWCCR
jgi:hypothetical protein